MQNELSFGVEFNRKKIEAILADASVTRIVVYGTYAYQGGGKWDMHAFAKGISPNQSDKDGEDPQEADCIQPCPATP